MRFFIREYLIGYKVGNSKGSCLLPLLGDTPTLAAYLVIIQLRLATS
jgi:hypothetical protein